METFGAAVASVVGPFSMFTATFSETTEVEVEVSVIGVGVLEAFLSTSESAGSTGLFSASITGVPTVVLASSELWVITNSGVVEPVAEAVEEVLVLVVVVEVVDDTVDDAVVVVDVVVETVVVDAVVVVVDVVVDAVVVVEVVVVTVVEGIDVVVVVDTVVDLTSSLTSRDSRISLAASNSVVASVGGKVVMLTLVVPLVSRLVVASVTASLPGATSTFSFIINVSVSSIASKPELSEISFITAGGMVMIAKGKSESFAVVEVVETDVASLIAGLDVVDKIALTSSSAKVGFGLAVALVVKGVVAVINSGPVELFWVSSIPTEISLNVIPGEAVELSGNMIPGVDDFEGISSGVSSSWYSGRSSISSETSIGTMLEVDDSGVVTLNSCSDFSVVLDSVV